MKLAGPRGAHPAVSIVRAFPRRHRLYAAARFMIIRPVILGAIEQRLPSSGTVLDLGCGFGLFTLWMALRKPEAEFIGLDTDAARIALARGAAAALGARNTRFEQGDIRTWKPPVPLAAVLAVDLLHHLPPGSDRDVLAAVRRALRPGGIFVAKDVDNRPRAGRLMCRFTDFVTSPGRGVGYAPAQERLAQLREAGFEALELRRFTPVLPYPHIVLVSSTPG